MKVSIDSRTIQPGDIFIPVKGERFDGHDFIPEVIKKGGKVLDVELGAYAARYRKKLTAKVIAVTGSAGKTTMKDMLAAMLSIRYNVVKTHANFNNDIGVPLTLLNADARTEIIVIECGMRQKEDLARLAKIARPTHVVITNIGKSHIEFHRNQRGIAMAKSKLLQKRQKWEADKRIAFLNQQTPYVETLAKRADQTGYTVQLVRGDDILHQNLAFCYQIGAHFGLNTQEIKDGLSRYQSSEHRLCVTRHNGITIIDDTYNANPDGMAYAFRYAGTFPGRKLAVVGDMLELGTHAKAEHDRLIELAIDHGIDILFGFGPLSSQLESEIVSVSGYREKSKLCRDLVNELKKGDVVLLKGSRGMKMEECVDYIKQHY